MSRQSKTDFFITTFLNEYGVSDIIKRYSLPSEIAYTSGDGIFRSDATLGCKYKFFRFSSTLDYKKKSRCWNLTEKDKDTLNTIHSGLTFEKSGLICEYIKFFGMAEEEIIDEGIRTDIRNAICKLPCVNCGRTDDIQCDHKNDLYNDPRVLNTHTQTKEDFQPLCNNCNLRKRAVSLKTVKDKKRQPPPPSIRLLGIDFTQGDENYDSNDINAMVGTY